jgi:molybdate transport system substrate-binding protein
MTMSKTSARLRSWLAAVLVAVAACAQANELTVAAPNAVKESVKAVAERFEKQTGRRVNFIWGGSESIAKQVAEGEVFDVVVNTAPGVDRMVTEGYLLAGSRVDFSRSAVAVATRAGLPPPDVSTVAGLKAALLNAQSIAISSGASGRYLEQLFQKLGVAEQIKHKIRQPPSGAQIGDMLAAGEADLGFQQVTELMHAKGVQYLGPLPAEVQNYTVWAAGVHSRSPNVEAAQAFGRALKAPESGDAIRKSGMEPL